MNFKKSTLLYGLIFILFFFVIRFIYMEMLYQHTVTMFNFIYYYKNPENDFLFVIFIILFLTYILTTLTYKLLTNSLSISFLRFLYGFYFLSLVYFLFFKTIGISGVNLNPLTMTNDLFNGGSLIFLMNILFFIPIGFLFRLTIKTNLLFLFSIFSIELIQLTLSIGIFDINDILLNYLGFLIGTIVIQKISFKNLRLTSF